MKFPTCPRCGKLAMTQLGRSNSDLVRYTCTACGNKTPALAKDYGAWVKWAEGVS